MILDPLRQSSLRLRRKAWKRRRRVIDSPCTPECVVDGKPVIAFCSNDYPASPTPWN